MTDAERIARLEEDNHMLWVLLGEAINALPQPRRGRPDGDPRVWRHAGERPVKRLLRAIDGGAA